MKSDLALGDFIGVSAGENAGERAFAGAVGTHYRVDFAVVDVEADAFEDGFVFNSGVEVLDAEHRCSMLGVGGTCSYAQLSVKVD